MKQAFIEWCEGRCQRSPDKIILNTDGSEYLVRWHVIPRNPFFNIYLHDFQSSDDDRANHDHPWLFNISVYVRGNYKEHVGTLSSILKLRLAGDVVFRWGRSPHRVELFQGSYGPLPVRTIFITGPVVRKWGFYCPKGWVHWKIFTSLSNGIATISKGCD